jgi:hypothetical protein
MRRGALHAERCCAAAQSLPRVGPRWQVSSPRRRHGWPSAADAATRGDLVAQPMVAVAVAVQGVRTPTMPVVACPRSVSAVRTSVQWSGGRLVSTRRPVSNATGAIRTSGRTGVRCPRRLHPRCRSSAQVGPGARGDGWTWLHERRRQAWPSRRPPEAAAPRSPPGRPRGWSSGRCRPVGWEARQEGLTVLPQVRPGPVAGWMPDRRLNREVVTTLRGRCGGEGPRCPASEGPFELGGGRECGRSAAAVCEERCPQGADSALTCENCGGRDRV